MTPGRRGHARAAVLTVIPEEFAELQAVLGTTANVPGSPYFVMPGEGNRPDFVCQETDRGNLQAHSATRDLIEDWRPQFIALCGIAGGIDGRDGVSPGDVVVPSYIHYSSYSKLLPGGEQRRYIPFDAPSPHLHRNYVVPLSKQRDWIPDGLRAKSPSRTKVPNVITGSMIAGDKLFGDATSEEQKRAVTEWTDAIAIDMESVGVCRAVCEARNHSLYNPQLLIFRGISDMIGDSQNNASRRRWRAFAASAAAHFAHAVMRAILKHEPDTRLVTWSAS